jgi:hypothetical protein
LKELDAEITRIQKAIAAYRPMRMEEIVSNMREHIENAVSRLLESLRTEADADIARAKDAPTRHLGKLVLTPATLDGRAVYRVVGNVIVPAAGGRERCRLRLVARDGYPQHSTLASIPLTDIFLDPRLELPDRSLAL